MIFVYILNLIGVVASAIILGSFFGYVSPHYEGVVQYSILYLWFVEIIGNAVGLLIGLPLIGFLPIAAKMALDSKDYKNALESSKVAKPPTSKFGRYFWRIVFVLEIAAVVVANHVPTACMMTISFVVSIIASAIFDGIVASLWDTRQKAEAALGN